MVRDSVLDQVHNHPGVKDIRAEVERQVRAGEITPALASQQILDAASN
jgi:LAO/AO transport system kinase